MLDPKLLKAACALDDFGPADDKAIHNTIGEGFFNSTQWLLDRWVEDGYFRQIGDNIYELTPFRGQWIAYVGHQLAG